MRGWLVNYSPLAQPEFKRTTSLVRTDTEGFACEVMFVKEFRTLRKASRFWFSLSDFMKHSTIACLILFLALGVAVPYLEYRLG